MTGGIFNLIKVSDHLIPLQAKMLIIESSGSSHTHEDEEQIEAGDRRNVREKS